MDYIDKYFDSEDSHLPIITDDLRVQRVNGTDGFKALAGDWHLHVICLKGNSSWIVGGRTIDCVASDFVDQVNSDELSLVKCSPDYEAIVIGMRRGFVTSLIATEPPFNYSFMKYMTMKNCFHLSEQSMARIMHSLFEISAMANRTDNPTNSRMIRLVVQLYLFEIATCFGNDVDNPDADPDVSVVMVQLFRKFMKELDDNIEQEHSVLFYASQFNVTPQYLNRVVKQISGDTVKVWINKKLLTLISHRLLSSTDTVQQIAYQFNFSDAAMLTKYFKTCMKKTPSQFRLE